MRNHVKIRKDYTILVRARKLDEAQKLLEIMWDRSESNPQMVEPVKKEVVKQEIKKDKPAEEVGYDSLDSLNKIKGIGKKTVKDIKTMFNNIKELKKALKKNNVALRDDIVEKLKEVLM